MLLTLLPLALAQDPTPEEPADDAPATEEPAAPATEEPAAEEPATEEPAAPPTEEPAVEAPPVEPVPDETSSEAGAEAASAKTAASEAAAAEAAAAEAAAAEEAAVKAADETRRAAEEAARQAEDAARLAAEQAAREAAAAERDATDGGPRKLGLADSPSGYGLGITMGIPTGIALGYRPDKRWMASGALAWDFGARSFQIHGDLNWTLVEIEDEAAPLLSFPLTAGVGAKFASRTSAGNWTPEAGVRMPLAFHVVPHEVPVDAFLEFVPVLLMFPSTTLELNAAIGVRVYFD